MFLYPATIRPAVSAETIGKVTRMFNGSIYDVIAELFQNARRAGASSIEVTLDDSRSPAWAMIRDNGCGIASPEHFVTLGRSGWGKDVREAEDPAGMGVFSLAGARVNVTSYPEGAAIAWAAAIEPEAWTGEHDIAVMAADHPVGTTIAFELSEAWLAKLPDAVAHQARHLPIPVSFQGKECPRQDWLDETFYRATWNGCTIGVVENHLRSSTTINFHGLTVQAELAEVSEKRGRKFTAIVDMGPSNDVQLVLPARKEVVQNAAWAALREAAERVVYEAIATLPDHKLAFVQWRRARELGVDLPEAMPVLQFWRARHADGHRSGHWGFEPVGADGAIVMPALEPVTATPFDRALNGHPLRERLAEPEDQFAGYGWYDALPRIGDILFSVSGQGEEFSIVDGQAEPMPGQHVMADTITLGFMLRYEGCGIPYQLPADLALIADEVYSWSHLFDTTIVWRDCEALTPANVIDALESAFFCPGEDHDDDCEETQRERFTEEATDLVMEMMRGADEALCDQFRRALWSMASTVPKGKQIEATITGDGPIIRLIELATEAA